MKYSTVTILALTSLSNASPLPQFSLPSFGDFSLPSFPRPTAGFSFGDFSLPSFPRPTGGFSFGDLSPPSLPSDPGASATAALPTGILSTPTGGVTQPSATVSAPDSGTVKSDCTPQSTRGGSSENGIKDKNCCTGMTVIFARGTGELGNVGTVSGPPMFKALREKLGADKVTVQGVDYAASAAGNANLGRDGGPEMASLVKAALSQCPSTKVIVSGYSQGGMVVHNAFSAQGLSSAQVAGAVLFGDPLISQGVGDLSTDKVKQFCGTSDTVCRQPSGGVNGGHLSYGSVADEAAAFVIAAAGLA